MFGMRSESSGIYLSCVFWSISSAKFLNEVSIIQNNYIRFSTLESSVKISIGQFNQLYRLWEVWMLDVGCITAAWWCGWRDCFIVFVMINIREELQSATLPLHHLFYLEPVSIHRHIPLKQLQCLCYQTQSELHCLRNPEWDQIILVSFSDSRIVGISPRTSPRTRPAMLICYGLSIETGADIWQTLIYYRCPSVPHPLPLPGSGKENVANDPASCFQMNIKSCHLILYSFYCYSWLRVEV